MKKNDEGFICFNCGAEVSKLGYTSRNHCNVCLYSKHIDVVPGDRQNDCNGVLVPIFAELKRGEFDILFKCQKCGQKRRNKAAIDDNRDMLVALTVAEY